MDNNIRLLIADDNRPVLTYLELVAERIFPDSQIRTVEDGTSLVKAAAREKQDIIITDYDMPGKLGTQAIKEIRGFDSEVYMIMFSSDNTIEDEARRSGANIFARKPNDDELIEALKGYHAYIATRRIPFRRAL